MDKSYFGILFKYLPIRISRALHLLPDEILSALTEVRLRKSLPVSVTAMGKNIVFDNNGKICNISKAICADESEIAECVSKLTKNSLYTAEEYIALGFIPLAEGGRAGVCGKARIHNGKAIGFSEIYSVCLRLNRLVADFASPLIEEYFKNGIRGAIVCSPPALGKTTFLRSALYMLGRGIGIPPKRVGVADERAELSAGLKSCGLADIVSGMPKSEAINILTRTMSPEIIICDEITASETEQILEAQNTGVALLASAHCEDIFGFIRRGKLKTLVDSGVFPLCVTLGYNSGYTVKVEKTEELL